jgi:hypothetical protein
VTKALGGGEHRLHVSMSKRTVELRERAKELMTGKDDDEILQKAFEVLLDQIDPLRRASRRAARKAKPAAKKPTELSTLKVPQPKPRRPTRAVSDQACVEADGQCTYIARDGTRCTSRTFLQDEHHQPFALGGDSAIDNISKLCAAHNALRARQVFGEARVAEAIARRSDGQRGMSRPAARAASMSAGLGSAATSTQSECLRDWGSTLPAETTAAISPSMISGPPESPAAEALSVPEGAGMDSWPVRPMTTTMPPAGGWAMFWP